MFRNKGYSYHKKVFEMVEYKFHELLKKHTFCIIIELLCIRDGQLLHLLKHCIIYDPNDKRETLQSTHILHMISIFTIQGVV